MTEPTNPLSPTAPVVPTPKRYDLDTESYGIHCDVVEAEHGDFVYFEDYAALEAKLAEENEYSDRYKRLAESAGEALAKARCDRDTLRTQLEETQEKLASTEARLSLCESDKDNIGRMLSSVGDTCRKLEADNEALRNQLTQWATHAVKLSTAINDFLKAAPVQSETK